MHFIDAQQKFSVQFINVYAPQFETAGKFWPIVHNSVIFSLVLMHAIAVGVFTLKKLSLASTLIFPLPVFTLLFNEYCRKRFLPNFISYPAEVCLKDVLLVTLRFPPIDKSFCPDVNLIFLFMFQSLLKKDRQDENDPAMPEFFSKLVGCYQDPALMPFHYSANADRQSSPLLSSSSSTQS